MRKYNRLYRLLDKVAKEFFPVTESEMNCRNTQMEHEKYVREPIRVNIMRHFYSVDDGMVIKMR